MTIHELPAHVALVWEEPPPQVPRVNGSSMYQTQIDALKGRPGHWLFITETTDGNGRSLEYAIRDGIRGWGPCGAFEVESRAAAYGMRKVWAKYVGEPEEVEARDIVNANATTSASEPTSSTD